MSLRKTFAALGALCATCLFASSADAQLFQVQISVNGGLQATVDDNGAGDLNPAVGSISIIDGVGGVNIGSFNLFIDTAISNAVTGIGAPIAILTNTVNALSEGIGNTLEVFVSATDYNFPGTTTKSLNSSLTNNVAAVGGGTVEFQSWADPANALYGQTVTTGVQTLPAGAVAADGPISEQFDSGIPFSLTNRTRITINEASSTVLVTGATSVSPVPEPGSMALLAMGGASLIGYGWRRRKAQAV